MYGDSVVDDLIQFGTAAATGYALATVAKATGNGFWPAVGAAGVGVAGLGGKHLIRRPTARALLGAAGSGAGAYVGTWVAAVTPTIGGKPAGGVPFSLPTVTSGGSTGGAARAAAERVAAAIRARSMATRVQRAAGTSPYPPVNPPTGLQAAAVYESDYAA